MHEGKKRLLHLLQFRLQPLPRRLPSKGEVPRPVDPAIMREPQKREALRQPHDCLRKTQGQAVRYSFPVRLFHSLLHAGLSRGTS